MINKVKLVIYFLFLSCCSLFAQKPTFTPIVFVHGFLGSGDTYASQFQRFQDVGYSNDQLFVYDWNSIGARVNNSAMPIHIYFNNRHIYLPRRKSDTEGIMVVVLN